MVRTLGLTLRDENLANAEWDLALLMCGHYRRGRVEWDRVQVNSSNAKDHVTLAEMNLRLEEQKGLAESQVLWVWGGETGERGEEERSKSERERARENTELSIMNIDAKAATVCHQSFCRWLSGAEFLKSLGS